MALGEPVHGHRVYRSRTLRGESHESEALRPAPWSHARGEPELLKAILELGDVIANVGYTVKRDMPGLVGPEVEELYARGKAGLGDERA
jgi:hypothetical protein